MSATFTLPPSFWEDALSRLTRDPAFLLVYGAVVIAVVVATVWSWTAKVPTRRPVAAGPASPNDVRRFKESAWRTRAAVDSYLTRTADRSRAMRLEEETALRVAHGRVLDIGAGTGRFSRQLAAHGHHVVALDLSAEMLQAGQRLARDPYRSVVASAFQLPFAAQSFDTVVSFWLLVHFAEWRRIVAEMLRVARPGGTVVFEIQNGENFRRGCDLNPAAPFVTRVTTPEGFNAFSTPDEIVAVASSLGARATMFRYYDTFNDNFIAQAVLGARYEAWEREMADLCRSEACQRYWDDFEATVLPAHAPALARKIICVIRKGDRAGDPDGDAAVTAVSPDSLDEATRTSQRLFMNAFASTMPAELRRRFPAETTAAR